MLKVLWTAKMSNEEILKQVNEEKNIITELRKRQSKFIGHILRKGKLEYIVTTGKLKGRGDRGRRRSLTKWHRRESTTQLTENTRNREVWRK